MIVDWLITLAGNVSSFFISFVPGSNDIDQGIVHAGDGLTNVFALMGSLGVWVNWPGLAGAITLVMTLYFASLLARIFRNLLSHIPFIGGTG